MHVGRYSNSTRVPYLAPCSEIRKKYRSLPLVPKDAYGHPLMTVENTERATRTRLLGYSFSRSADAVMRSWGILPMNGYVCMVE